MGAAKAAIDTTVVVCDDDAGVRGMFSRGLRAGGLAVVAETASVEELLAAVALHDPDVVLLDVNLPGRTGLEGLALLRSRGERPAVVLVSGDEGYEEDAGATGVAFLHKGSFSLAALCASVRRAAQATASRESR